VARTRPLALDRLSLSEQVREEVLRRILDGTLRAGDRIVETRLAQELGTSQAPIREALRSLEPLGVVQSLPNRGVRVRVLQASELAEIYLVRAELEAYAASLAAPKLKANVSALEQHIAAMHRAAASRNLSRFSEANALFHRHVVEASGLVTLVEIWAMLDVKARTMLAVTRSGLDLGAVAESHWPIVEALKAGKAAAARRAMRQHILRYKPTP
jgi:DNA-binding GntR family transcriptional regulator